jgi:arylsulfatase A-like enzyme
MRHELALLGAAGIVGAAPALWALRTHPQTRYAAESAASPTGKAVAALRRATPRAAPWASGRMPGAPQHAGVPRPAGPRASVRGLDAGPGLDAGRGVDSAATSADTPGADAAAREPRDPSVLLVTVDALRADRLEAYGARGRTTPRLDAFARDAVVFRRAYTTTPHTSYALGGLMTGKHLRAAFASAPPGAVHPTLADALGARGWQTAAFYPPAVFYVDGERFGRLRAEGFGFRTRSERFDDAATRVRAALHWLAEADRARPVLLWVHVFEPHEPYEPPPRFRRGDLAVERYDGEVAAADEAIGELIAGFDRVRPGATVIVTADHGEEFGEHGGAFHGTSLHDEQVRVPLLWRTEGWAAPRAIDDAVDASSVTPTLLAMLGVPRDPRMTGDVLDDLLGGGARAAPTYAIASTLGAWMATDGRHKAICEDGEAECRLFDLVADPRERRDLARALPTVADALRAAISGLVARAAAAERQSSRDAALERLARAEAGDPSVLGELSTVLGDERPALRARAARLLGERAPGRERASLRRMVSEDPDRLVRAEAALALLRAGDASMRPALASLVFPRAAPVGAAGALPSPGAAGAEASADLDPDLSRRAAVALAALGDASGQRVLLDALTSAAEPRAARAAVIEAVGRLRLRDALDPLVAALDDETLRTVAAKALGSLGDSRARPALLAAARAEPYPAARAAEAQALLALTPRRDLRGRAEIAALVSRWLGDDVGVPDGVALLLAAGPPPTSAAAPLDLRRVSGRRGLSGFRCDERGCVPGPGASARLTRAPGSSAAGVVVVARVGQAEADATLAVGGEAPRSLPGLPAEIVFRLPAAALAGPLEIVGTGSPRIEALAVVPAVSDRGADGAGAPATTSRRGAAPPPAPSGGDGLPPAPADGDGPVAPRGAGAYLPGDDRAEPRPGPPTARAAPRVARRTVARGARRRSGRARPPAGGRERRPSRLERRGARRRAALHAPQARRGALRRAPPPSHGGGRPRPRRPRRRRPLTRPVCRPPFLRRPRRPRPGRRPGAAARACGRRRTGRGRPRPGRRGTPRRSGCPARPVVAAAGGARRGTPRATTTSPGSRRPRGAPAPTAHGARRRAYA